MARRLHQPEAVNRPSPPLDLERAEAILPRYAVPVPRYTSYPAAPLWGEAYGADEFEADLGALAPDGTISLYVHVPFCRSLCHFCACNRMITRDPELPAGYLDAIAREIEALSRALPALPVVQQHWGGGTPTHLSPAQIERLHGMVTDALPTAGRVESSIEVDPRVTTEGHLEVLRRCGFDRISLGVQDFDPHVQEAVHRIQPVEQTAELVELSRRHGFRSVGFDLIYGLPFQREASFERTLDTVLSLRPDRVALYSYAHVTWVAKQQRGFERKDLPDPRTKLRIFVRALRRFLEAGYVPIGMDHFSLPADDLSRALAARTLRRNFMGYTTQAGAFLVGLGPSAISDLRSSYAQSHRDLRAWQALVQEGRLATLRGHRLSADDLARRWIIEQLMCLGEVEAREYERAFGHAFAERYGPELGRLEPLEADGLLVRLADGGLRVTPLGRLLVRHIATVFDATLSSGEVSAPRFSQGV